MHSCASIWSLSRPTVVAIKQQSHNYHEILLQASPQLTRILRAYRLGVFFRGSSTDFSAIPLRVRLLLDLSWDELRAAICPLREIIGDDKPALHELFPAALDETLFAEFNVDSVLWDFARSGLRVTKGVISGELEKYYG